MRVAAALAALLVLAGCAGGEAAPGPAPPPAPAPPPPPVAPPPADAAEREAIVRAWSDALNRGDNLAAAELFVLPAIVVQGEFAGEFRTREDLTAWHASLPCSGRIVEISYDGPRVIVVFELGDRAEGACDAPPGTRAAAIFLIRAGAIVGWRQIPPPDATSPDAA